MIQANVHEAKTQLSKLIQRAEAGEEVVIARNGRPAVRLTPVEPSAGLKRDRDIVGCMPDIRLASDQQWRRLEADIAAEMEDMAKFDVELDDSLEFIPATRP